MRWPDKTGRLWTGEVKESIVFPSTSSQWFLIACWLEIDGIRGMVQPRTLRGNRRTEVRSCEGSYLALLSVMHILHWLLKRMELLAETNVASPNYCC